MQVKGHYNIYSFQNNENVQVKVVTRNITGHPSNLKSTCQRTTLLGRVYHISELSSHLDRIQKEPVEYSNTKQSKQTWKNGLDQVRLQKNNFS